MLDSNINLFFALGGVILLGSIIFVASKVFGNVMKGGGETDYAAKNTKGKDVPLSQVFYEYQHKSVDDWCRWIATQDEEIKDAAFKKLNIYINRNAESLGLIASDAIKAMGSLDHPEAFNSVNDFMVKMRNSWGVTRM